MTQYISKSALVAEIKRRISLFKKEKKTEKWCAGASQMNVVSLGARIAMLEEILSFLDTLEVKEVREETVNEDLEEAAEEYAHDLVHDDVFENFIAGVQWQKEQILGNDNKQYHRLRHETLKRLYENEAKLELMLDKALEGYIEKYEQIGGHNYLSLKIPMLSKPDDCKDGDKIKLIIIKEE